MSIWIALGAFVPFVCAGTIEVTRADRTYFNDRMSLNQPVQLMDGDLNGDGARDLVILLQSGGWDADVFYGGIAESASLFSERRGTHIVPPAGAAAFIKLADMNGDGRDDLLLIVSGDVRVYLTPATLPIEWDLRSAVPDLALTGGGINAAAVGDLNGDGRMDLALGATAAAPSGRTDAGRCYLYFSSGSWTGGSAALASHPTVKIIHGKVAYDHLGAAVLIGDLNRDGAKDVVVSAENAGDSGGIFIAKDGEAYVFFHSSGLPTGFDLAVSTPDVTLQGYFHRLMARAMGDVNGDGSPELLVSRMYSLGLIDGGDLSSGRSWLNLDASSTQPIAVRSLGANDYYYSDAGGVGDFDGDGVDDVFVTRVLSPFGTHYTGGFLSAESSAIPFPLVDRATPSVTFPSMSSHFLLTDWNGDGRQDVVSYQSYPTPRPPSVSYGELNVFYGFSPLWDPAAEVKAVTPGRVRLGLGVRGRAAEVRFTGDVEAGENGRWMPYAGERTVTLTGTGGTKSVQVTYRDAEGRESAVVTVNVTPPEGGGGVTVFNNRVTGDSPGAVDVDMPRGGHVRARVVSRRGREIATVMDEDRGPGVTAVTWDGKNEAGEVVAAGVYTLVIDYGGRRDRRTVVVER